MTSRAAVLIVLTILLAACSTAESTLNTPVPTVALIPATETAAPTPVPPSQTPADLPAPGDIAPTLAATANGESESGDALLTQDVIAAELVVIAQRQVAAALDVSERRVQLVEVIPMLWTDSSLNCPLPDQTVTPMAIDGYRIVLEAGDREYVFHADFDRVLPCDPTNEALPTEEPTAEVTETT